MNYLTTLFVCETLQHNDSWFGMRGMPNFS